MRRSKFFFITFEGIEGSGKSYQSSKLYKNIQNKKKPVLLTREPGGSKSSEEIRNIILSGVKNKYLKITDTLLYLAARNEHYNKVIKPMIKKKNIICDRFTDSTLAYQVYGKGVDRKLVDNLHNNILGKFKPDLTIILTVSIKKAFSRMKKRKHKNRYDKFSKEFYKKVQNSFIKLAKTNNKRYFVLDNTNDSKDVEKIIFNKFLKLCS